jgi:hypothetical protein
MPSQSITIPLTRGKLATVDAEDYERVAAFKWRAHSSRGKWYAGRSVMLNGKRQLILLHRVIMDAPPDREVDHINGDGLICTRANMRLCTHRQNTANRQMGRNNTTGFFGVSRQPECARWRAMVAGKYLGLFKTPEEAARAYDAKAREVFGEFARLNFPD